MYNVVFNMKADDVVYDIETKVFIHDVQDHSMAQRIASNLVEEGFVGYAWVLEQ